MMILFTLTLLLVFASSYSSPISANDVIVDLPGQGKLKGSTTESAWTQRTIYQFQNVKYAKAPVGQLRFKPPQKLRPWRGIKDATTEVVRCPQYAIVANYTTEQLRGAEDCLSLSVYSNDLTARRPVFVYIHGGGFYEGGSADHPPQYYLEKDIVLVVPQYRLGPLGFLSTMTDNIPGNAGMLDMVLALEWVQKHIIYFGGDPKQVTIGGQSAGASAVAILSYSPFVPQTYFNRVIMQSGGSTGTWVVDPSPIKSTLEIAQAAGCYTYGTIECVEQCLMNLTVMELLEAYNNQKMVSALSGLDKVGGARIVVGGPSNFLPKTPYELMMINDGRKNLSMLAGVVKNEGTFLLPIIYEILRFTENIDSPDFNTFELIDTVNRIIGVDDPTGTLTGYEIKSLFPKDVLLSGNFLKMVNGLTSLMGTSFLKAPLLRDVHLNFRNNPGNTYLYSFDYTGEFTRYGYGADMSKYPFNGGVHHSNDNIYLFPFPAFAAHLNENDKKIAVKMIDLWTSFIIGGAPKSENVPSWPPVSNIFGPYIHINKTCPIGDDFYDEFSV